VKIVIDMGHGGNDPGASGNGLIEADLTGQLGQIIAQKLSGYDAEVLLAPRDTLSERAAFANSVQADYFISVHVNAGGGTGYESHIHPDETGQGITIAETIHGIMAAFYAQYGFKDRGLKRSNFAVLRETKMPAILLENLFIDNSIDAAFLSSHLPIIGNEGAYALAQGLGLQQKVSPLDNEVKRLQAIIDQKEVELAAAYDKLQKSEERFRLAKQVLTDVSLRCAPFVLK